MKRQPKIPLEAHGDRMNCAVVALSAVTGVPYSEMREICLRHGWNGPSGRGMTPAEQGAVLRELGYEYRDCRWLRGGTVRQAEQSIRETGARLMIRVERHVGALVDGETHDTSYRPRCRVLQVWEVVPAGETPRLTQEGHLQLLLDVVAMDILRESDEVEIGDLADRLGVTEKRARGVLDTLKGRGHRIVCTRRRHFALTA